MSTAVTCATSLSPVANLSDYLRAVFEFPQLSPGEERELAMRLRRDNDSAAAWSLVTSHLRYVVFIARGYMGYGLPQEELIQEGNVGLMEAVKRFDPDQGVPLRAYAAYSIRYHIHEFIIRNWRLVKVATTKARRKLFFKLRSTKKALGWLNHREAMEIAQRLEVDLDDIDHMEASLCLQDKSLDPVEADEVDSPAVTNILSDRTYDPEAQIETAEFNHKAWAAVELGLSRLDHRSRRILESRWLGEHKATLEALAGEFGVSIERVRQIEGAALQKLKAHVRGCLGTPALEQGSG